MSVYFITCRDAGAVKIGSSGDPRLRLKEVQLGCPLEAKLEGLHHGSFEEEHSYHRRFADDRLRGEWFTLTPTIEAIIAANPVPAQAEIEPAVTAINDAAEQLGITRPVLAQRLRLTVSELSRYEDGREMPLELRARFERATEYYTRKRLARNLKRKAA
jgi:hypothetical protein